MCSYDGSGSYPHAVGFLLLSLIIMAVTAIPNVRTSRPGSRGLLVLGLLLLMVAVWTFWTDPFTQPAPCSD